MQDEITERHKMMQESDALVKRMQEAHEASVKATADERAEEVRRAAEELQASKQRLLALMVQSTDKEAQMKVRSAYLCWVGTAQVWETWEGEGGGGGLGGLGMKAWAGRGLGSLS